MINLDNLTDRQLKNRKKSLEKKERNIHRDQRRIKRSLGDVNLEIEKRELERKIQCIK